GDVAGGTALDLGDEDAVGLAADPILDPGFIQSVAALAGEMTVIVEAGVDVVLPRKGLQDGEVRLLGRPDQDLAGCRCRRSAAALQGDPEVDHPETLVLREADRPRIFEAGQ